MNLEWNLIFFISEDAGYFLNVTLLLLLNSTFLLIVKSVSKKKRFFSSLAHGINLGSFASRAISLSLSHGDIGR